MFDMWNCIIQTDVKLIICIQQLKKSLQSAVNAVIDLQIGLMQPHAATVSVLLSKTTKEQQECFFPP
jgi:hypothetical protein